MIHLIHCAISGIAAIVAIAAAITAITFAKIAMRRCDLSDARLLEQAGRHGPRRKFAGFALLCDQPADAFRAVWRNSDGPVLHLLAGERHLLLSVREEVARELASAILCPQYGRENCELTTRCYPPADEGGDTKSGDVEPGSRCGSGRQCSCCFIGCAKGSSP
ncbi:hypothetical protein [Burkholderia sp. MSHR3999]|uniref:hypothetical protein n=1 Tax=Burkholderia sp. MSHR3999 TaxID=1542965 RepID=UPI0012E062CA|nr:hypothetical protein [Burkholderia sp. MSHR3999]